VKCASTCPDPALLDKPAVAPISASPNPSNASGQP
jgi:hypothetical protein